MLEDVTFRVHQIKLAGVEVFNHTLAREQMFRFAGIDFIPVMSFIDEPEVFLLVNKKYPKGKLIKNKSLKA
mgnify:CR=1 FL=1